jgi:hypothetical protein
VLRSASQQVWPPRKGLARPPPRPPASAALAPRCHITTRPSPPAHHTSSCSPHALRLLLALRAARCAVPAPRAQPLARRSPPFFPHALLARPQDTARQLVQLTCALARQFTGRTSQLSGQPPLTTWQRRAAADAAAAAAEARAGGGGAAAAVAAGSAAGGSWAGGRVATSEPVQQSAQQAEVVGAGVGEEAEPLPSFAAWCAGLKGFNSVTKVQHMFGLMLCACPGARHDSRRQWHRVERERQ